MNVALGNLVKNIPPASCIIENIWGGGVQLDGDFCREEGKRKGKSMFFFFQQSEKKIIGNKRSVLERFSSRTVKLVSFFVNIFPVISAFAWHRCFWLMLQPPILPPACSDSYLALLGSSHKAKLWPSCSMCYQNQTGGSTNKGRILVAFNAR